MRYAGWNENAFVYCCNIFVNGFTVCTVHLKNDRTQGAGNKCTALQPMELSQMKENWDRSRERVKEYERGLSRVPTLCVYGWTMDSIMSRKIDFIFYNAHLFYCAAAALHFNASLDGSIHCCRWFFFLLFSSFFPNSSIFFPQNFYNKNQQHPAEVCGI